MELLKRKVIPKIAFQFEASQGGFQLYKIEFNDDYTKFKREKVESPDAWAQVINYLEIELSKLFQ